MKADNSDDHGLNQITGYLLWNAEIEQARRQAAAFTTHLPWLTTAQREDVERVYVADRLGVSQAMLKRIRDRALELREEYQARYASLRRQCVAVSATFVAVAIGVTTAAFLLSR